MLAPLPKMALVLWRGQGQDQGQERDLAPDLAHDA